MNVENLPKKLTALNEIAHNYWWSWDAKAQLLFSKINSEIWAETRNPVKVLKNSASKLIELEGNADFVKEVGIVSKELKNYVTRKDRWFHETYPKKKNETVVYFSAEYGIHEALPIYSGGLGVLSGDHVKSASDLGIPMVFVGLFYKDGYFIQQINREGQQVDTYKLNPAEDLSVNLALDTNGKPVKISVKLPGRIVSAQVWEAKVGVSTLLLLDTNLPENKTEDKELTARLYGGDREMRISQEVILGIGGIKALEEMGINGTVFHMNEGHSGFFQLERVSNLMKKEKLSFEEARLICSANCLFTTHTPVPAGNEAFELPLMHKFFYEYIKDFDISWDRFLNLGMVSEKSDYKYFSLTVFAINFSRFQNGVSELHGRISSKMWKNMWPDVPEIDNPITHITNGIHVQTWTSPEIKGLYSKFMGEDWEDQLSNHQWWEKARDLPHIEIREIKKNLKNRMIGLVRKQLKAQLKRNGEPQNEIDEVDSYLRDDVLTIGFARRFATYKRATLIFKDPYRLSKIVNDPERPVQFVFAGKAHPADIPGQTFIKEIYQMSRRPEFRGKIIILENYDMNVSRHMVSGSDVWLNNPRRPMEASGTSGQKVPINIGLNFSVLDGWWREGYNGKNGWVIGQEKDFENNEIQDFEDANDFYKTLDETVKPLYYADRNKGEKGESDQWICEAKESLISNISNYSTHRMVQDYMTNLYGPAMEYREILNPKKKKSVIEYVNTRRFLKRNWETIVFKGLKLHGHTVEVGSRYDEVKNTPSHHVEIPVDDTLPGRVFETVESGIDMYFYAGDIDPKNLIVEAVASKQGSEEIITLPLTIENRSSDGICHAIGQFNSPDGQPRRLRFRVLATKADLVNKFELGLVTWY